MSVAYDSILVIKKGKLMETYVNKSSIVIESLRKSNGFDSAYPMAFGYAWALLSPKQRLEIIKFAERKVAEMENN